MLDIQHKDKIESLFILAKEGDTKAFEKLFKLLYADLCNYAVSFLKEKDSAEEIVQGLFCKIWENKKSIDISASFKSYCFRAVHNQCLNTIKHIQIRENYKEHNQNERANSENTYNDELVKKELEEHINKVIEALPEMRKKVFKLSRFEGLKYREIADKLKISVKTVENHMGKSLSSLREDLSGYLPLILLFLINYFYKH